MNESHPVIRIEIEGFAHTLGHLELAALAVVMTTICVVTVAGNLLVLLSFIIDKKLRTRNNYFVLSLAASDTMIGTFSMPLFTLYALNGEWLYGPVLCDMWLAQDYTCSCASSLHLVIIALDRYFSVVSPLRYRARKDSRLVGAMIGCVWVLSFLMWPPWIYAWQYIEGERTVPADDCYVQFLETNVAATLVTSAVTYYVPVSVIGFLYFRIWRETVKRKRFLATMESRHDRGESSRVEVPVVTRMSSSSRSDGVPGNASPRNQPLSPKSLPDSGVASSEPPFPVAEMAVEMSSLCTRSDMTPNNSLPSNQPWITSLPISLPGSRDSSTVAEMPVPMSSLSTCSDVKTNNSLPGNQPLVTSSPKSLLDSGDNSTVAEMPVPMSSLCTCSDMKPNNSLPGNQPWVTSLPKSLPGSGDSSTVAEMVIPMSSSTSCSDMKTHESLPGNQPRVTSSPISLLASGVNSSQPSDTVAEIIIPMSSSTSCSDMKPRDSLPGNQSRVTSTPKSSLGSGVNSSQPPDTVTETAVVVSGNLAATITKNKPKATGRHNNAAGSTRSSSGKSSDNKAAKMLAAILCAFFVTATPYNVMITIMSIGPNVNVPDAVWFFVYYLFYINSALDPICYALANKQFRKTYWKVLTFSWGRQRPSARGSKPTKGGSSSKITRL